MKKAFVLYADQYEPIRTLSDAQSGILFKMLFEYNNTGTTPDAEKTDPMVFMAFMFLKNTLDRDNDKYLKKCEKNKENADKRWNANASERIPMNANHADRDKNRGRDKDRYINLLSDSHESGQTKKQFKKPSIEEITIYCQERKNRVDPDKFFNFYESKGWMIGKNKMKNWRSAIITWEKGEDEKPGYRKNESNSLFNNNNGPEYAEL